MNTEREFQEGIEGIDYIVHPLTGRKFGVPLSFLLTDNGHYMNKHDGSLWEVRYTVRHVQLAKPGARRSLREI
jgi:hypothetical protein